MGSIAGIDGQVCSTAELGLSVASPGNQYPNITCLTRGQSIGLAFLAQAGCISFVSVLIIYVLIIRNILRHRNHGSWKLLKRPADIYVLSLINLDAIQAWGQILSAYWVMTGKVYAGSFCTAQGLLQQFGETGVAVTSLTITLSTFINVFWRKGIHNRTFAFFVVSITWLFSTLWVIVGASTHDNPEAPYINPTPYWCWINARYFGERVGGEYFWLWTALLASILLYPPIYLWSNGNLSVDARFWWRFHYHHTPPKLNIQGRRRRAFTILAYPAAYSIVVLPVSVIRFTGFGLEARGQSIPSIVTFISITLFALSGAMNVLLLITTRPNLLLFGHPQGEKDDDAMGFASDMMITLVTITQERITAEHPRELSLPPGRVKSALAYSDVDDDDNTMTMVESSEGHIFDSSSSEGV